MNVINAAPAVRDEFLRALDEGDHPAAVRLAKGLVGCTNPLPGLACVQLEIPAGSTYGSAAARVLALYGAPG